LKYFLELLIPDFLKNIGSLYPIFHIASIYLSYSAFFVATAAAILYLAQDSLLKSRQAAELIDRLPNLFLLDRLNYTAIGYGFPMLTVAIISGFIWSADMQGLHSYNLREIYAIALWLIYALILHVRLSYRLRGRRVAQLSLVAFCIIILTFFSQCR